MPELAVSQVWLHGHNDYQKRPALHRALRWSIPSVEADIYLHEGRLVVSHLPIFLKRKPTLESLYLQPLTQLFGAHPASSRMPWLRLMIDIKSEPQATVDSLRSLLRRFPALTAHQGQSITIFLSGKARRTHLLPGDSLFWGLDDPIPALFNGRLIPDRWTRQASMSYREFKRLFLKPYSPSQRDSIVRTLTTWFAARKIPLRLYGAGNRPRHWNRLVRWGFTVINVDRYKRASRWCQNMFL
ncbi:MAG: hypothetical protein N2110_04055 [Flavobacteriales bacterium]|nr:hypothetical protein [Flavobacteriales bacterium]